MKIPEFDFTNVFANGYCGCPLCTAKVEEDSNADVFGVVDTAFNGLVKFFRARKQCNAAGCFQTGWQAEAFADEIDGDVEFAADAFAMLNENSFIDSCMQPGQAVLLNCLSGSIIVFITCLDESSAYYKKTYGFTMDSSDLYLYVPAGYAYAIYSPEQSYVSFKISEKHDCDACQHYHLMDLAMGDSIVYFDSDGNSYVFSAYLLNDCATSDSDICSD